MTLADNSTRKKLFLYLLISITVLFSLISLVLSPLYTVATSNIAYMYSLLPSIILILTDMLNFLAMVISFSIIVYTIIKFGMRTSSSFVLTYIIACFLKYTLDMLLSYLILKRVDVYTIVNSVGAFFIDLLLIFIAAFIAYARYKKDRSLKSAAIGCSILVATSKVISRAIYDISMGPPTDVTDLIWMIVSYASDLIIGVIFLIFTFLIFNFLKKKETAE